MRPPHFIHRLSIVQLDVQVLIYALERPADLDFVLEFDGDFVLDERFEETSHSSLAPMQYLPCTSDGEYMAAYDGPEEEHCKVCGIW
jgi:hypothetical protein